MDQFLAATVVTDVEFYIKAIEFMELFTKIAGGIAAVAIISGAYYLVIVPVLRKL